MFLTGTRADFGKMKPLILAAQKSERFDTRVFVTGMHMLARYGNTLREVEKAGVRNIFTYINQLDSTSSHMDLVLASTVQGLGHYVREHRPDLIVVHGDRVETLAGAIVGALNNILVAHVEGGELSGTVDELIRHAVTKLSHVHFVANDDARRRLVQLGEIPESIFVIGSPDIDVMLSDGLPSLGDVRTKYAIPFAEYHVLVYHPVTTEPARTRGNAKAVVDAVVSSGDNFVVIYPNNDAGSEVILEEYATLTANPRFRLLPSMRFEHFLTLLKHARSIVGNSSAGVREAPVYGVPTVNVGSRQHGRSSLGTMRNIPEDGAAILQALRALPSRAEPSLNFGRGRSASQFMSSLGTEGFWKTSSQKYFVDIAT